MRNILVTGFGPFGGEPINPALEAIKLLDGRQIGDYTIVTRELPVTRFASIEAMEKFIAETDPVLVLAVGQAGGRLEITPERVAINHLETTSRASHSFLSSILMSCHEALRHIAKLMCIVLSP